MVEAMVQLGGDITKESEENAGKSRALKEAYGGAKGREDASIHVDETTPHLHCDFVLLTKRGIYRRKTTKKCAGRKREIS